MEETQLLHITSLNDGLDIFKALGSDVRIEILNILLDNNNMSMNELASRLNITNGALTSHIKKLESCGLISISSESAGHCNQKICSVHLDKILIDLERQEDILNVYSTDVKVGHYSVYRVCPTCGLASDKTIIGEVDDSRYFDHPDRYSADILWFTKGFVEYNIPNFIPSLQKITQLTISAELSSEAPGVNNVWPSDISFYLNDVCIGNWLSPGDFGDSRGLFTPDWWFPNWNQYGLLKLLVINRRGTFIDGLKISDVTIDSFHLDYRSSLRFRLAVDDDAEHVGGLTIFGKTFDGGTVSTLHWALTDTTGVTLLMEYVDGKLNTYKGRELRVLTNDPPLPQMNAIDQYWTQVGGVNMLPGTVRSSDRFVRASFFIKHVPTDFDYPQALGSLMSIMGTVSVPYGYEIEGEPNVSSTQWTSVADCTGGKYYFKLATSTGALWVDMGRLVLTPGAPVLKLDMSKHAQATGCANNLLEKSAPFTPMW